EADTCSHQILLEAGGSSPLPQGQGGDPTLAGAFAHLTVELTCDQFSPPCNPFPVDVDLTWTGFGSIDQSQNSGLREVCPAFLVEAAPGPVSPRSATVAGDLPSGGPSLIAGLASFALLRDFHSGANIPFLSLASEPPHPCRP